MELNRDEWLGLAPEVENDHQVIELLVGDLHCPLCGAAYEPSAIHFVRQRPDTLTLAVQCYCCGTGSLITVRRKCPPPPAMLELTPDERTFFSRIPPLSHADVQRIRCLLKAHTGDLRDLL